MKQFFISIFSIFAVLIIGGCSRPAESKIIGIWTGFDQNDGIREIHFSEDSVTIRTYRYGETPDKEINSAYKIIDDILFMENYIDNYNSWFSSPAYSYAISGDTLFLVSADLHYTHIYTKKHDGKKFEKNSLTGVWVCETESIKIELIFTDDGNVKIKDYDEQGKLFKAVSIPFELTEHYLILKVKDAGSLSDEEIPSYFYAASFVYKADKDRLYLLECISGEISARSFFFRRQENQGTGRK